MTKLYFFIVFIVSCTFLTAQNIVGVDVSHWQGTINWTQVKNSGKTFAYVKSTEGRTYTDPKYSTNMSKGAAAGIVMGAYHFARPVNNSADDEVNSFLRVAGSHIGNGFLPPVLDVEANAKSIGWSRLCTWVKRWMYLVKIKTGVTPVIYINGEYARNLCSSLNTYGLWIANFETSQTSPPRTIGVWNDWFYKQYSEKGSVPGIRGYADLDVFKGTANDFQALIGNITSGTPDVVIENMWTVPANPSVGENVDLYVAIKNVGDGVAENIKLKYYVDGRYYTSDTHSSLAPNGIRNEYANNFVFRNTGRHKYCVYVDKVTNEDNSANNSYCVNVSVTSSGWFAENDEIGDQLESSLSVSGFNLQEQLKVYPNPTTGAVYLESASDVIINKIFIYDLTGRFIKQAAGNNLKSIDLTELRSGLYLLKTISDKGEEAVFRIIKK